MPAPHSPRATALLLLLNALASALACHHPDDTFSWDSLRLLQDMAPSPTSLCQHRHVPLLNDTLLHTNHPQQAAAAARRLLQHLLDTFNSSSVPQAWDDRARQQLLNSLHWEVQHLNQCLKTVTASPVPTQGAPDPLLAINKYFSRLQRFLLTHHHSACAWDHVRLQARACFKSVDTLIRQMKSPAAATLQQPHPRQMALGSQRQRPLITRRHQQTRLASLSTARASASQEPVPLGK